MFNAKKRKMRNAAQNARAEYQTRVLSAQSSFLVSEAYNKLRTNLMYTLADKKCPVIGVTGSFKGCGKSLTLANLAIALSQLGKRVLILDGDFRRVSTRKRLHDIAERGMSDYISNPDHICEKHEVNFNLVIRDSTAIIPRP